MPVRFQDKRGTATQWRLANPVLADGEFGIESDTGVVKVGNGLDPWNARPPILGSTYLPILGKAADADKLDGLDSTAFLKVTDATATYLPLTTAASTYVPQSNTSYNNDINTVVKRDASGNTTVNQLTISQSTPQSANQAARKDYVDAVSTALTNATDSAAATRKLSYYWGVVTSFPTVGVLPGDTCVRSNIGTNGSWWSYTGVSALGSNGWLPESTITCLSTTRPTVALFKGLQIYESDTQFVWEYDGTSAWLPITPGAVSGKAWKTTGASPVYGANVVNAGGGVALDSGRVFGGTTFSFINGTNYGVMTLPLDGLYEISARGYLTGGGTGNANFNVNRTRSGVALIITQAHTSKWSASFDEIRQETTTVPLKAGDALGMTLDTGAFSTAMAYYGNSEAQGCMFSARWVAPLNGTTPL